MGRDERVSSLLASSMPVLDRFGRELRPGDLVLYDNPHQQVFRVVDVQRPMGLAAHPSHKLVTMVCESGVTVQAGTPTIELVKVGSVTVADEQQQQRDQQQES